MRFRTAVLTALIGVALVAIPVSVEAAIPFYGPIIPKDINACPLGWGAVILIINNIIQLLFTLILTFLAPIMIAYSGFLFVVNPVNPKGKEQAKSILWNTVEGLVIAMAAWLIVNALLVTLTGQNVSVWTAVFGTKGYPACLPQAGTGQHTPIGVQPPGGVITVPPITSFPGIQCSPGNPACSVAALQAVGFTAPQANAMSCIAMTESSGNPYTPNSPTGACGTFQIVNGNWKDPSLHKAPCSTATSCNDPACNLQTAFLLAQRRAAKGQSVYSDWTCPGCNTKAAACVAKYDPGR